MASLNRFLREFLRPGSQAVEAIETTCDRGGGRRDPATVYRPVGVRGPLPAWVVLHGITWTGREHAQLVRFARALSASGSVVMVPEISEWRALRVAPEVTVEVIRSAVLDLDARPDTVGGHTRLVGFSFGATQAIIAASDARLDGHLSAVAAWGGYADLRRLCRFLFTGEHELDGRVESENPDLYGRWVLGANALTAVPEHADAGDVQEALRELATSSGRQGVFAGSPAYDPLKLELRERIAPERRALFDLFAPRGEDRAVRGPAVDELAARLAEAAIRRDPLYDATAWLGRARVPVLLTHGRHDLLIPYTESTRLHRGLGERSLGAHVTDLYAHSGAGGVRNALHAAVEWLKMVRLMKRLIDLG